MRDRTSSQDLMTPCLALLNSLSLEQLDQDWVNQVWEEQFTEAHDLPGDYEEVLRGVNVGETLSKLRQIISDWMTRQGITPATEEQRDDSGSSTHSVDIYGANFWTILSEEKIPVKSLLAVLYQFQERGLAMAREEKERELCLQSAGLYLVLLGLPGSGAFKIFHPVLFSKALDSFSLVSKLKLAVVDSKRGKKNSSQSQSQSQSQRRRHASGGSQGEEEEEVGLTQRESEKVVRGLSGVLDCLHVMLDSCSLKRSEESLEALVTHLVALTKLETQFGQFDLTAPQRPGDVSSLAIKAYLGLTKLCSPLHGAEAGAVSAVLRSLVPSILMVGEGSGRALTVIRAHTLRFVRVLMEAGGEPVSKAVTILTQHLALRVPDKADFRREAAEAIVTLISALRPSLRAENVQWFIRLAHSEKTSNRVLSLEVLGRLMYSEQMRQEDDGEEVPDIAEAEAEEGDEAGERGEKEKTSGPVVQNQTAAISNKFLFAAIYGRCGDVSASVRAQALKILGDITTDQTPAVRELLNDIFAPDKANRGPLNMPELLQQEDLDLTTINFLPSSAELVTFLRGRALDQSVFVRKSALQVLENILRSSNSLMAEDLVSVLAEHCRDSSLAVRKQMVISLTELVRTYPENVSLIKVWVNGVFPLILDVEAKAAEKVLECVWECLFRNLVHKKNSSTVQHKLPWIILKQVEVCRMANYLSRACHSWAKDNTLTNTHIHNLQSYIGSEHNGPAWMLIGLITAHIPCKDPGTVMDYFNDAIANPEGVGLYTLLQVLKVLFASVSNLSKEDRASLKQNLQGLVKKFKIPPELIPTSVDVITVISSLEVEKDNMVQYQSSVDSWTVPMLETINTHLTSVFLQETTGETVDEDLLSRQIFTLGELCQVSPHRINQKMFLLMQSIVYQDQEANLTVTSQSSQPQTQTPRIQFVPSLKLQSLTVVTLGKMCLQHEDKAKKIIPAFGQILECSTDPAMKNNIMYVLSDMCVRYASIVDPLLPQMTTCLKDKYLPVRRTTLINLIRLLQTDYLKIRGNGKFFFRLLHTLLDPCEEIRHLATFYIQQRLMKKFPNIMYTFFAESIFHFNDFTEHSSFNKFTMSDKERQLFDLSGDQKIEKRRNLYRFMLENMDDEHRFKTTYKLCQDILNGVVDGHLKISPASLPVLRDTFHCLSSDDIKLSSLKSKAGEDDPDQDQAGMILEAGKKAIISKTVKSTYMEVIIPIIIALKHKFESVKSPLLKDLYNYLRKLMEDYKSEVSEVLAADKQLASEIEFDLRRHEQEEQERRQREERLAMERRRSKSKTSSPNRSQVRTPAGSPRASVSTPGSSPSTPASGGRTGRKGRGDLMRRALYNAAQVDGRSKGSGDVSREKTVNQSGAVEETEQAPDSSPVPTPPAEQSRSTTLVPEEQGAEEEGVRSEDNNDSRNSTETQSKNTQDGIEEEGHVPDGSGQATSDETVIPEEVPENERVEDIENDKDHDHDKSKRVSGQGMPRPKTPKSKRFHNIRAISTPQASKTVLGDNVTFRQDESSLDLSAITVLSPQSSIADPDSRRQSSAKQDDTDAVSFRFKRGGKNLFDNLVDGESGAAPGKRKAEEESQRQSKGRDKKTRSSSQLVSIREEEPESEGR